MSAIQLIQHTFADHKPSRAWRLRTAALKDLGRTSAVMLAIALTSGFSAGVLSGVLGS